ncbi:MAG: CBS domain-containing protein [Candidatus Omnitrophica bacterium]|nr:CBS domain-containing protein [Candidatus Omnitrophota bacterium]
MSKEEPTVQKFMTCQPHSVDAGVSLQQAERMMSDLKIRHLPVMKDGRVFGIISDRDIKTAVSMIGADLQKMAVRDICQVPVYEVSPESLLHEVADEMAAHHYGSVVVVQNSKLVGILTTVDICRAFSHVLQQRYHHTV